MQSHSKPIHDFVRTTCACDGCKACCKRQPGSLAHGDYERIASYIAKTQNVSFEIAFETLKKQLWASPGALVKDSLTGRTMRIGSITPRYRKGRCVFLDENDKCKIHEVAPFGCSMFDTHMPYDDAHRRSLYLATSQMEPDYQALRDALPYATSYKPNSY